VVPEGDAKALVEAIRRLLADGALRDRLARMGRERAEQNFSWERVAEKTHELFRQVLSSRTDQTSARAEKQTQRALGIGTLEAGS